MDGYNSTTSKETRRSSVCTSCCDSFCNKAVLEFIEYVQDDMVSLRKMCTKRDAAYVIYLVAGQIMRIFNLGVFLCTLGNAYGLQKKSLYGCNINLYTGCSSFIL